MQFFLGLGFSTVDVKNEVRIASPQQLPFLSFSSAARLVRLVSAGTAFPPALLASPLAQNIQSQGL